MVLVRTRTRFKNRIDATLAKYALTVTDVSDLFGTQGRALLADKLAQLPPHTRSANQPSAEQVEILNEQIAEFEDRMREAFKKTPALEWLMSLPSVGFILGMVILLEVDDVHRFPDAEHLGIGLWTVYDWISAGKLEARRDDHGHVPFSPAVKGASRHKMTSPARVRAKLAPNYEGCGPLAKTNSC